MTVVLIYFLLSPTTQTMRVFACISVEKKIISESLETAKYNQNVCFSMSRKCVNAKSHKYYHLRPLLVIIVLNGFIIVSVVLELQQQQQQNGIIIKTCCLLYHFPK